jgi:hypothetical protein
MAKRSASPEKDFSKVEETNLRNAKIHLRTVIPSLPFVDVSRQSLADKQRHIEDLCEEHTWMLKSVIDNVGNMNNPTLMDNVIRRLQKSKKFVNEAREITEKKTLPYTMCSAPKNPKTS